MDIGLKEIFYFVIPAILAIMDILIYSGFFKNVIGVIDKSADTLKEFSKYLSSSVGHKNAKYFSLAMTIIYIALMIIFG